MYADLKRRFRRQGARLPLAGAGGGGGLAGDVVLVAVVVASVALLASFLWVMPVFFVGLPTVSYLVYVFRRSGR